MARNNRWMARVCVGAGALLLGIASGADGQVVASNRCVPPLNGQYAGCVASFNPPGAPNVVLSSLSQGHFTSCQPAPSVFIGNTIVVNGSSTLDFDLTIGGVAQGHVSATGFTSVRYVGIAFASPPQVEIFECEELSMDMSGGGMPAGMMLRESPTTASLGTTTISDIGGGLNRIDGFFNLRIELTMDGGMTWIPADAPVRIALGPALTTVACCSPTTGACGVMPDTTCAALGLVQISGIAGCLPNPCPAVVGACCHGATCTQTAGPAPCGTAGTFLGAGVACGPIGRGGPLNACCPADFNHSGVLGVQDIFDFLAAWFAGCP